VNTYCRLGPEVSTSGSSQEPDGSFTVTLSIANPTRESVRVESPAYRNGDTTWEPASTTVPPQDTGELVVNGVVLEMDKAVSEQC
jgi:hypothetical protein